MKTSNFRNYEGDNGVAICIYPPADWKGLRYLNLAPDRQTFYAYKNGTITADQSKKLYFDNVLSKLDPQKVYDTFKNNVLLCWENPGEICHRRWVAEWIENNLGIEVPEWNAADEKLEKLTKDKKINPLF